MCATSKFSLYNMWTYIVYYHLTGAQWHKCHIKTERSSGVQLIEATSSLTRKICTCIPRSQLNFLSWRVFRHFQPLCRFETVIYLFIDLDICQGGGFATPSGVIREALFAKSTKIDGVISRALAADQILSCLTTVPSFLQARTITIRRRAPALTLIETSTFKLIE